MGIETLNEELELNIPMFDDDMDIISKLDDEPNAVGGLTAAELKAEFDRPGKTIKKYLNETLVPSLIGTVAEESVRAQNEYIRVTNENQRVANENGRVEEEERRNTAELERIENEDSRGDNETKRAQAETARAAAEAQRESAEQAREDKTSGIVAQATEQANEAKNQAERAEGQANKAGDEADRAAEQANKAKNEADRAKEQATLAGQVKSMQAEATTLSAGSEATAKVEEENGDLVLRVGIPVGRDGKDGLQGPVGPAGADGVSPVATVESIEGGHRVTITDAEGPKSFDVMNGKDGSGTGGGSGGGVSKASELENDVPFVSAVEQSLTDDQKAQARVNIGAATVEIEYQNIGSASFVLFDITDGNGESHHLQWSKDPAKPKDGGVWVPQFNEETSMLEWDYYQADALYPVPMPTPVGIPIPDKTSDLENDSEFVELPTMQQSIQQVYDTTNVFIPQNPTEAQKAQARENIGVENVLESIGSGDTLTWDYNTEGLPCVDEFYKISDATPRLENYSCAVSFGDESMTFTNADYPAEEVQTGFWMACFDSVLVVFEEAVGVDIFGLTFSEPGTYLQSTFSGMQPNFISLTIPGYTGFAKKQIKTEYIPDSVPQVQTAAVGQTIVVSEVDADGKPTKWEAADMGAADVWELIYYGEITEDVNGITVDKDSNGETFSLKDYKLVIKTVAATESPNGGFSWFTHNNDNDIKGPFYTINGAVGGKTLVFTGKLCGNCWYCQYISDSGNSVAQTMRNDLCPDGSGGPSAVPVYKLKLFANAGNTCGAGSKVALFGVRA